jgi:BASS family bile acid:Na+ symporter
MESGQTAAHCGHFLHYDTTMQGDFLSTIVLPLGLAFIMFTLGAGLTLTDFKRVFLHPKAFAIGVLCHFILLPLVAYGVVMAFGVTGAMAVGFMIIAACPTGTTSNLLTYHARADVALALSFTAVAGVVAVFTIPLILDWSLTHFMGAQQQVAFPYGLVMGQIALLLGVPVALGMLLRKSAPDFTRRFHGTMGLIATVLFVLIVLAAIAKNWGLLKEHAPSLAPMVLAINLVMLLIGLGLSLLARVPLRQAATVAIESSVQNSTLAIVISSTILMNDTMMLPAAVYGILMYFTGILFVLITRRFMPARTAGEEAAAQAAMH